MTEMLRFKAVTQATGYPRGTVYEHIKRGTFPKPVAMGMRTAAWPRYEVEKIVQARIAGKSDDEIRALVYQLMERRKQAAQ